MRVFNANIEAAKKARDDELARAVEIDAREMRFAAPVPCPQRDPSMSNADYLKLLKKEKAEREEIAQLEAERAAAATALAETARLKAQIKPMEAEPSSVLATFSHLVDTYRIPEAAAAVAPTSTPTPTYPVPAAAAPTPTVFVTNLVTPSAVTETHPPAPRPSFTVTVPTPGPSPTKELPPLSDADMAEVDALFPADLMPRPGEEPPRKLTDEEFEKELNRVGPDSDNGPSDDEDSDDNAGDVTVTSLEGEDDALEDEDAIMQDESKVP